MAPKTPEEIKQEQIKKAKDKAMGRTMPETIAVDISNINTNDVVGGQMSSRQKIRVQLEDGSVIEGFYTEDNYTDYYQQFDAYMQQITNEYNADPQKSELGAEFLNKIKDKFNPYAIYAAMVNTTGEDNIKGIYNTDLFNGGNINTGLFLTNLKSMDQSEDREYIQYLSLFDDSKFRKIFKDLGKKSVVLGSGIAGNLDKGQLSENKRNVNRRNNALYEVSALLGHKDLVCQSVNMTTIKNDKQTYGSFMVNAKGTDYEKVNCFVTRTGQKIPMEYSGKAKKDMSRLQVLDFICGNADRHSGNFFYDIEYVKSDENDTIGKLIIKGLQGIDNDLSFGKLQGQGASVTGYMSNVDDIKIIDKDQKDAILDPDFAKGFEKEMRLLNLSQDEIAAGLGRLSLLKEKLIRGNEIEVIDNEERWNNLDTRPLETSLSENEINIWKTGQDIIQKSQLGTKIHIGEFLHPMSEIPPKLSQAKNESSKLLFSSQLKDLKTLKEEFDKTNPEKASKEFKKMYDSLGSLIKRIEGVKDKDTLSDIEFNKISMGFKQVIDNTNEYIRLKPKNPRSQNGKDRLHCAKNMLTQATQGRHMVLEENTAAFSRRMTAEYNKFNRDYKALVDIDKALQDKNNPPAQQYYVDSIKAINSMSKANPADEKLQYASAILQEKLLIGLGKDAFQSKLPKEDITACLDILKKHQRNVDGLGINEQSADQYIALIENHKGWTNSKNIPEELQSGGTLEQLEDFKKKSNLTGKDLEFIDMRIASEKFYAKFLEETVDPVTTRVETKEDGSFKLPEIKQDEFQSSGNGCYSCAMKLLMQGQGINMSQKQIRAYRGDQMEDNGRAFGDKMGNAFELGGLLVSKLKNTGICEARIEGLDKNTGKETRDATKTAIIELVTKSIKQYHSPVALMSGSHYVTIVGYDKGRDSFIVKDSKATSHDGTVRKDSNKDYYLAVDELTNMKKLHFTYAFPIDPKDPTKEMADSDGVEFVDGRFLYSNAGDIGLVDNFGYPDSRLMFGSRPVCDKVKMFTNYKVPMKMEIPQEMIVPGVNDGKIKSPKDDPKKQAIIRKIDEEIQSIFPSDNKVIVSKGSTLAAIKFAQSTSQEKADDFNNDPKILTSQDFARYIYLRTVKDNMDKYTPLQADRALKNDRKFGEDKVYNNVALLQLISAYQPKPGKKIHSATPDEMYSAYTGYVQYNKDLSKIQKMSQSELEAYRDSIEQKKASGEKKYLVMSYEVKQFMKQREKILQKNENSLQKNENSMQAEPIAPQKQ